MEIKVKVNLILFIRDMSENPSINGIKTLPQPSIMNDVTVKKIITNAYLVIMVLNIWSLLINDPISNQMIILIDEPNIFLQKEKIK